jgi:hypothetical protein
MLDHLTIRSKDAQFLATFFKWLSLLLTKYKWTAIHNCTTVNDEFLSCLQCKKFRGVRCQSIMWPTSISVIIIIAPIIAVMVFITVIFVIVASFGWKSRTNIPIFVITGVIGQGWGSHPHLHSCSLQRLFLMSLRGNGRSLFLNERSNHQPYLAESSCALK